MCIIITPKPIWKQGYRWCTCFADLSTSVSLEFCGDLVELDGMDNWAGSCGMDTWLSTYFPDLNV